MKNIILTLLSLYLFSCNQPTANVEALQTRIDNLENQLKNVYTPGFGSFMNGIEVHHTKLWSAGLEENWKLASFEIHEMAEGIEDIQKYQKARSESQMIEMINPALDSVSLAIKNESLSAFKSSYALLTNACNKCHRDTKYEFIIIKDSI